MSAEEADPDPSTPSGVLLVAARSGSEPAMGALLARHLGPLRAFVRLQISPFLRRFESESDLLQSVCRVVIQQADQFEYRGEAAFRSWLYRAVLNTVRDHERHYRAQKRAPARQLAHDDAPLSEAYHSLSPSRVAMVAEQLEMVEAAFTRLPGRYAQALTLHHFVGLSRSELGEELGISTEAASALLRRATVRLSRELADFDSQA